MFGIFKKRKNPIAEMVDEHGEEAAAVVIAAQILKMLPTREIAWQFVLEEIEAASHGNTAALRFVARCGVAPRDYEGSLGNSRPEVDGPGGPQQTVVAISSQLEHDEDVMVRVRTGILDGVMRHHQFGRHGPGRTPATNRGEYLSARYNQGVMRLQGQGGVARDLGIAYEAFLEAAEAGHARAQYNLGVMHNTGTHAKHDPAIAAAWFAKAAENGHADAAFNLAHLLSTGTGMEQNLQQAHQYMCLAADKGHADALEYVKQFLASKGLDRNGKPLG